MNMVELIEKKKAGKALNEEEIEYIIRDYTANRIPDYQMSAFLMAVCFQGMNIREITCMTQAMEHSGEVADLSELGEYTADKHSSGGVGDKTSLVLCPIMAECGVKMAKMSGRALEHTGGTIDKLESIPGFSADLSPQEFMEQAKTVGCVIAGQTGVFAPADKKIYALRDVTGTVGSIPLIAASIMSKKLAGGSRTIVLDVKTGSGAFMKTEAEAIELAKTMVYVGNLAGRNTAAVVTDMDQPLGRAVGNALEVKEAIAVLRGEDVPDLREECFILGSQILQRSGLAPDDAEARRQMEEAVSGGRALERFAAMVRAQHGDPRAVYDTSLLPQAPVQYSVTAPRDGYISAMKTSEIGMVSVRLGGGRTVKGMPIDPSVGIMFSRKHGDHVSRGDELAVIHAADRGSAERGAAELLDCFEFDDKQPERKPIVRAVVPDI